VVTSGGPIARLAAGLLGGGADLHSRLAPVVVNASVTKVVVGALHHNYSYDANHARVLKVVPQSGGVQDRVTIYAGEIEVDDTGTWTKYVHDDVKRTGNGGAAQRFQVELVWGSPGQRPGPGFRDRPPRVR